MSPVGITESEVHQTETQRSTQSSPAISADSRASSQAAYYHHHSEGHSEHDGMSGFGSTYSFVSPSEAPSIRTGESEAESSVGSGKRFRFPRIKLSLTAAPPKPKPKPKKQPPTPKSGVCSTPFSSRFILGSYTRILQVLFVIAGIFWSWGCWKCLPCFVYYIPNNTYYRAKP